MTINTLIKKHSDKADLHITRVMGAFVVISEGRIIEIDRTSALQYCPLQNLLSGKSIEKYVQEKIVKFGHFTAERKIMRSSIGVPFGTSEMFMYALRKNVLDCAVIVCDGAGTVITSDPEIVQGIGARMNGLFHTTPIPRIQNSLRNKRCILFDNAVIDQCRGLNVAIDHGYSKIGMTINGCHGENPRNIRQTEKAASVKVSVATVCTTGIDKEGANNIVKQTDMAWSCASKHMRDTGWKALLQVTLGIPVFVYTAKGLEILASYSDKAGAKILTNLNLQKQYLLSSVPGKRKVQLGKKCLYLSEAVLPIRGKHEPFPLT